MNVWRGKKFEKTRDSGAPSPDLRPGLAAGQLLGQNSSKIPFRSWFADDVAKDYCRPSQTMVTAKLDSANR